MSLTLTDRIRQFYDASSGLWEQVWGEHMHHGYYGPAGNLKKDRRQAQIDLIEELLSWGLGSEGIGEWGGSSSSPAILDVGCGIGGSSLYLADKFSATVTGITLSPVQASRATERAKGAGLASQVSFAVVDALNTPFADESFDFVWSLESGEHMPNKIKFLQECSRLLRPGGTLLMATWCHRPLEGVAGELTDAERKHLADIYRVYALPYVISLPEYEAIARRFPLTNIRTADWSTAVAPFWNEVIDSALNLNSIMGLLLSGWTTVEAALSLDLMKRGYESGLVRFGVLCAQKSSSN